MNSVYQGVEMIRETDIKPLCVGKGLWPCSSMANIVTQIWPKYEILVTSGSGEKN
jgi:hypothetical protein